MVLAATAALFTILASFSGFTVLVEKRLDNRCITSTYAFMLMISLIIFGGIAIAGNKVRDEVA